MEATHWLVALQEQPGSQEVRRNFDAWRRSSALNEAAWAEVRQLADVAQTMVPAYADRWRPLVAHRRRGTAGPGRPTVSHTGYRRQLVVAALALAACVALFVVPSLLQQLQSDYVTATAELRKLSLPDGSEVTLAPASAIALSFDAGERRVRLLSGEAFFEVRPEASRPFLVTARSVEASVLGTRFDVRMDRDGVTVAVAEGSVRVESAVGLRGHAEKLLAGQGVRVAWTGAALPSPVSAELVGAWRDGRLVAQDQSLREAIDQLRRYYAGTILLTNASLGEKRVTGAYNLADPEDALRGLARAHGARVRRITPWILMISDS
jgi:transmembrane sensor